MAGVKLLDGAVDPHLPDGKTDTFSETPASDNDNSDSDYDTEDELEDDTDPAVLVPSACQVTGAPLQLDVAPTGSAMAPSNVPLVVVTNPRSIYNKLSKMKTWLKTVQPDLCILSEHWGRKAHLQETFEDLPQYNVLEYSRARVQYRARRNLPATNNARGGGAAIIYNMNRFDVEELVIDNPQGVEAVFAILVMHCFVLFLPSLVFLSCYKSVFLSFPFYRTQVQS